MVPSFLDYSISRYHSKTRNSIVLQRDQSDILTRRTFLKVQINFVERILFTPKRGKLESLLKGKHQKLEALFTEYKEYATVIHFETYDI